MISKNKIKFIEKLAEKKERYAAQQFVVEGNKIVEEVLIHQPHRIIEIFALPNWLSQTQIPGHIAVTAVDDAMLQRLSTLSTANTAIAIVQLVQPEALPVPTANQFTLLIDDLQNPGNLGTIIRLADWYHIENIVCSLNTVDYTNAKVLQATMGSFLHVQVHYTDLLPYLQQYTNVPSYAATLHGQLLHQMEPAKGGILAIGNEGRGIDPNLVMQCSFQVTIPKYGKAESLNAGVATGILLSHFVR
jgi:TrmH family RNA methyltransferase